MILTEDQASRIGPDGLIHDAERLKELQALPLERKIGISIARIIEWYQYWNGNVCVSFSGGKDSTVLMYLVRSIFPDVPAVFSNTGLEYPEIQKFVKSFDNVMTIYPEMNFKDVITKYGYPLISKEVAEAIYYARRIVPKIPGGGYSKRGTLSNWRRRTLLGVAPILGTNNGVQTSGTTWNPDGRRAWTPDRQLQKYRGGVFKT